MAEKRKYLLDKVKAYLEHYEVCRDKAYDSPVYQEHFKMADELIVIIVDGYENGEIDAKDLFDSDLDLASLFKITRDVPLKERALNLLPRIKKDIKEMFKS